jgi:hypothetical protein
MQPHPSITAIAADATTALLFGVATFTALSVSVVLVVRERRKRTNSEDNS